MAGLSGLCKGSRASQWLPVLAEADGGAAEKQGWPLVVATAAYTARQAWQGEQGCAQHRCRQSLFLKASNQTRRPVPTQTQPNSDSTRLA